MSWRMWEICVHLGNWASHLFFLMEGKTSSVTEERGCPVYTKNTWSLIVTF